MKLAVKAFAKDQESDPVHMKIVAASWTFTQRDQKSGNNQNGNPDAEQSSHGSVGG